ncbi:MAG: hypothetical protein WBC02_06735 [Candidatus Aminicenantaceae bacterium]
MSIFVSIFPSITAGNISQDKKDVKDGLRAGDVMEAALILRKESLEMMEEHRVEHGALRMSGAATARSNKSTNSITTFA